MYQALTGTRSKRITMNAKHEGMVPALMDLIAQHERQTKK